MYNEEERLMTLKREVKQRGFTLLELLMVVIIVGILASIALPSYLKMAERTRSAEALNMLAALRSAQVRHSMANDGEYATAIGDLDIELEASDWWTYTANVNGSAQASRSGTGDTIQITLATGDVCTSNVQVYSLAGCGGNVGP